MVSTKDGFRRTTISLREDDYEVLRFIAFKRKTSIAGLVKDMVQELLEDEEDIKDGLKALEDSSQTMDWDSFKRRYLEV